MRPNPQALGEGMSAGTMYCALDGKAKSKKNSTDSICLLFFIPLLFYAVRDKDFICAVSPALVQFSNVIIVELSSDMPCQNKVQKLH